MARDPNYTLGGGHYIGPGAPPPKNQSSGGAMGSAAQTAAMPFQDSSFYTPSSPFAIPPIGVRGTLQGFPVTNAQAMQPQRGNSTSSLMSNLLGGKAADPSDMFGTISEDGQSPLFKLLIERLIKDSRENQPNLLTNQI